jgi:hypothetical protein
MPERVPVEHGEVGKKKQININHTSESIRHSNKSSGQVPGQTRGQEVEEGQETIRHEIRTTYHHYHAKAELGGIE